MIKRAFPKKELLPMWILLPLTMRNKVDFLAYYDRDALCGITYTVKNENMIFLLYLAVNDEVRSKGYGSAILDHLKTAYPYKTISLNVEVLEPNADNYIQRQRRLSFYKKNGFQSTDCLLKYKNHKYLILSTSKDFSVKDYKAALKRFSWGFYVPKIEIL